MMDITIKGPMGCGKTTIARKIQEILLTEGKEVALLTDEASVGLRGYVDTATRLRTNGFKGVIIREELGA